MEKFEPNVKKQNKKTLLFKTNLVLLYHVQNWEEPLAGLSTRPLFGLGCSGQSGVLLQHFCMSVSLITPLSCPQKLSEVRYSKLLLRLHIHINIHINIHIHIRIHIRVHVHICLHIHIHRGVHILMNLSTSVSAGKRSLYYHQHVRGGRGEVKDAKACISNTAVWSSWTTRIFNNLICKWQNSQYCHSVPPLISTRIWIVSERWRTVSACGICYK